MNTIDWIIKQINIARLNISTITTDSDLYKSDYKKAMKLLNKIKERLILHDNKNIFKKDRRQQKTINEF